MLHISGIILCWPFCDWLISRSIISSKFIHVVACDRISFLLEVTQYSIVFIIHHILFIHSPVNGHLGCFYLLTIANSAAIYTWVCRYLLEILLSSLLDISRSETAGSYSSSIFTFLRKLHVVFHHNHIILQSYQQCTRDPTFPHTCQHLLFSGVLK